jgi:hypothetical protein
MPNGPLSPEGGLPQKVDTSNRPVRPPDDLRFTSLGRTARGPRVVNVESFRKEQGYGDNAFSGLTRVLKAIAQNKYARIAAIPVITAGALWLNTELGKRNSLEGQVLEMLNNRTPITEMQKQQGYKQYSQIVVTGTEGMEKLDRVNVRGEFNFFDGRIVGQVDQGTIIDNVIEVPGVKSPNGLPAKGLAFRCGDVKGNIFKDLRTVKPDPNSLCTIHYNYGINTKPPGANR